MTSWPRIAVLDPTPIGSLCATGQFKAMLFKDWPAGSIIELTTDLVQSTPLLRAGMGELQHLEQRELLTAIQQFAPDILYVRPEPEEVQHLDTLLYVLTWVRRPAVLHIMDDWVVGDWLPDQQARAQLLRIARGVAARAAVRYTDGPDYVEDFAERLGASFHNLLNGVDLDQWNGPAPAREPDQPFTITHMGNYTPTMSRQAVIDVARTVDRLQSKFPARFDIYLRGYIADAARSELKRYRGVRVLDQSENFDDYVAALRRSDVNLYGYNQDPASVRYMGKGIPNKTCELLAAGRPILAYGPPDFAGVKYLQRHAAAHIVSERAALTGAIETLRGVPEAGEALTASAARLVRERHDAAAIREKFLRDAHTAIQQPPQAMDFAPVMEEWGKQLRPRIIRMREQRARREVLYKGLSRLPAFALRSLGELHAFPLPIAATVILCAALAATQGPLNAAIAGAALGACAWLLSQAGVHTGRQFGRALFDPRQPKGISVRRAAAAYRRARWPLACTALLGAALGWLGLSLPVVAGAVLTLALALSIIVTGARYLGSFRRLKAERAARLIGRQAAA